MSAHYKHSDHTYHWGAHTALGALVRPVVHMFRDHHKEEEEEEEKQKQNWAFS